MRIGTVAGSPVQGNRVVVTGLGALSCCGVGVSALLAGLLEGTFSGDRMIPDFDPAVFFGPKEVRRVDRFAQVTVAAAVEAVTDSGLNEFDADRSAVIMGTGIGGMGTLVAQQQVLEERGAKRVSPFLAPMIMPNAGAAQVAMRFGCRGPVETITTACAAGTHAIAAGARLIASGRADVAIVGGGESVMEPITFAGFRNMTALSNEGFSRPFDVDRDGFVMSEGAGALVLERLEHAMQRGARIYGEVLGAASTADAFHITAPREDGSGARRCMELALDDAGISTAQVGTINAHARRQRGGRRDLRHHRRSLVADLSPLSRHAHAGHGIDEATRAITDPYGPLWGGRWGHQHHGGDPTRIRRVCPIVDLLEAQVRDDRPGDASLPGQARKSLVAHVGDDVVVRHDNQWRTPGA